MVELRLEESRPSFRAKQFVDVASALPGEKQDRDLACVSAQAHGY